MSINERKAEMLKRYVKDSLMEKFKYTAEKADKKVESSNLLESLKTNSTAIRFFDAEYWAGQISLNNI
ncbi:hypothetical protein SH2C18_09730 [Clostridium sediminicola]|uniref:hypothetical protein n=1 Tax=Clostridium sediminicola TaxID=3114879 RepID=UPI0031F1D81F